MKEAALGTVGHLAMSGPWLAEGVDVGVGFERRNDDLNKVEVSADANQCSAAKLFKRAGLPELRCWLCLQLGNLENTAPRQPRHHHRNLAQTVNKSSISYSLASPRLQKT